MAATTLRAMKRPLAAVLLVAGLVVGFLLVGPFIDPLLSEVGRRADDPPGATPVPSGFVEVTTYCGLDWALVRYEGEWWAFDVEDEAPLPEGWNNSAEVVRVEAGPAGPVVTGPDGSRWTLVRYRPSASPREACI